MNYLRISNDGLICPEDLTLIGSSTKRDQTNKIGMFGSGWKYALAWMLRNETKPIIFSGETEIKIDFTVKLHRSNPINVITVDGIETSLTTEMGPKWTGWMAIREVMSNAIDEGGHTINTIWSPSEFKGTNNETTIFIPMNGELSEVMIKFDAYFAFNRKISYSTEFGNIFFKTERSNMNIYRKSIRCYDTNIKTKADFDFHSINISEDRLTTEEYISQNIASIISSAIPVNIFKRLLDEEQLGWLPYEMNHNIMDNLKQLIDSGHTFTTDTMRQFAGVLFESEGAIMIPSTWFKKLNELGLVKSPFENVGGKQGFMRTDAKDLSEVQYHLKGLNLNFNAYSGKCNTDVFYSDHSIYVKDDTKLTAKQLIAHMFYGMSRAEIEDILI